MNHIEIKILEVKRPPYFKSKKPEDPWQGEQIKGHDRYDKTLEYARFRRPGEMELHSGKIYFGEVKESKGVDPQGNPKKDIFTPKHEMDKFEGIAIDVEELPDNPFDPPKLKFDSMHDKSIVTQSLIRSACMAYPSMEKEWTLVEVIDKLCKKYKEKMEQGDWL